MSQATLKRRVRPTGTAEGPTRMEVADEPATVQQVHVKGYATDSPEVLEAKGYTIVRPRPGGTLRVGVNQDELKQYARSGSRDQEVAFYQHWSPVWGLDDDEPAEEVLVLGPAHLVTTHGCGGMSVRLETSGPIAVRRRAA